MGQIITCSILFHVLIAQLSARSVSLYSLDRLRYFQDEDTLSLGGDLKLTDMETRANEILMHWKHQEIDSAFNSTEEFDLSKHFFSYKNKLNKSKVYQIIRRMPKGAALHVHASLMLDADSLLELTYEDHLYACYSDDELNLRFSTTVPSQECPYKWNLLSDLRKQTDDINLFDAKIKSFFTLYTEDESIYNDDIHATWERFEKVCWAIQGLISYRPVRETFFYRALENFYNDQVMYVEIRTGLHALYELDGSTHDQMYLAELYNEVTQKFIREHPDFVGMKLIVTTNRRKSIEGIRKVLNMTRALKSAMPDVIAGFDLVGQEDAGKPLKEHLPALEEVKGEIDFYFHGGETNWYGTSTDENLFDAIWLGSKRIGHAFALLKHPKLMAAIKENTIALEVNLISNVVLSLVSDVRNHPLATYFALGFPVVLSSDDPGVWGADPLSHDFYVAFVGVASRHADLRLLMQLALNSIEYSALDSAHKSRLLSVFYDRWDSFVKEVVENFSVS